MLSKGVDDLFLSYRLTVFWQVPWCQKEVEYTNKYHLNLNFFVLRHICCCFSATLLVAINEIKKSARQNGLSFYEYGLYNETLFCNPCLIELTLVLGETRGMFLPVPHLLV